MPQRKHTVPPHRPAGAWQHMAPAQQLRRPAPPPRRAARPHLRRGATLAPPQACSRSVAARTGRRASGRPRRRGSWPRSRRGVALQLHELAVGALLARAAALRVERGGVEAAGQAGDHQRGRAGAKPDNAARARGPSEGMTCPGMGVMCLSHGQIISCPALRSRGCQRHGIRCWPGWHVPAGAQAATLACAWSYMCHSCNKCMSVRLRQTHCPMLLDLINRRVHGFASPVPLTARCSVRHASFL